MGLVLKDNSTQDCLSTMESSFLQGRLTCHLMLDPSLLNHKEQSLKYEPCWWFIVVTTTKC